MKFTIELTDRKVFSSELKLKHYKEILKCSFGEPDFDSIFQTFSEIFQEIMQIELEELMHFSILDFLFLIYEARSIGLGNECNITAAVDKKQMNISLKLDLLKEDLSNAYSKFFPKTYTAGCVTIFFQNPTIARVLEDERKEIEPDYASFIHSIIYKDNKFLFETNEQVRRVFDSLPSQISTKITYELENALTKLTTINFLKRYQLPPDITLTFIPSVKSLIWFTKLLFSEPLDVFYDNMFYLTHLGNMDLNYIEQCSPGEYVYFVKRLQAVLSQKSASSTNNSSNDTIPAEQDFEMEDAVS